VRVLDAAQMRAADARGCARLGEVALMRAAGRCIAAQIADHFGYRSPRVKRYVAFAGPGNNGGDAFATFAELGLEHERIVYALESAAPSEARRDAETRASERGVVTRTFPASLDDARAALDGAHLALDALLGTGGRAEPDARMALAIDAMNEWSAGTGGEVFAVDIPTGVDATTGTISAHTVRADFTVALGALKYGVLVEPAREYAGVLTVADIGIGPEVDFVEGPRVESLEADEFVDLLPRRARESDKRRSGAPLVIAGSGQFPGAAVLAARAAARTGAGYVTVATEESAAAALRAHLVEEVVVTYDPHEPEEAIETLLDLTRRCTAVAIGPGLGLGEVTGNVVRGFLERLELPFVADASALFHLGKHLEILRGKRCVLTPHEGEFARLSGEGTVEPGTRRERLRAFVARTGITTLLKGAATLIDDGTTLHVNSTGTSALATAGTGDVLTGMIGTLLSQGLSSIDAARAAAYWHGATGRSAGELRRVGVVAGDLPERLGELVLQLEGDGRRPRPRKPSSVRRV
jgi:NAD(P)H-hydrate epimerase